MRKLLSTNGLIVCTIVEENDECTLMVVHIVNGSNYSVYCSGHCMNIMI